MFLMIQQLSTHFGNISIENISVLSDYFRNILILFGYFGNIPIWNIPILLVVQSFFYHNYFADQYGLILFISCVDKTLNRWYSALPFIMKASHYFFVQLYYSSSSPSIPLGNSKSYLIEIIISKQILKNTSIFLFYRVKSTSTIGGCQLDMTISSCAIRSSRSRC